MWGNFSNITKHLSDNAKQLSSNATAFAASTGFEEHLTKARSSMVGGLDALASNILVVEPAANGGGGGQVDKKGLRRPMNGEFERLHGEAEDQERSFAEEEQAGSGWDDDDLDLDSPDRERPKDDCCEEEQQEGWEGQEDCEGGGSGSGQKDTGFIEIPLGNEVAQENKNVPSIDRDAIAKDAIAKLRHDNLSLKRDNSALRKKAAAAERDLKKSLRAQHEAEDKARAADLAVDNARKEGREEAEAELLGMRRSLERAESEANRLEEMVEEMEEQMEAARAQFDAQLRAVGNAMQGPPATTQENIDELRQTITDLQAQLAQKEDISKISAVNEATEVQELREALSNFEERVCGSRAAFHALLTQISVLGCAVEAASVAAEASNSQADEVAELERDIAVSGLYMDICPLFKVLEEVDAGLERTLSIGCRSSGVALESQSTAKDSLASGGVAQVTSEDLRKQLVKMEAEVDAAQGQIMKLKAAAEQSEHEMQLSKSRHKDAIEGYAAELESVRGKLDVAERHAAEAEEMRGQIDGLTAALEAALESADQKAGGEAELRASLWELQALEAESRSAARQQREELQSSVQKVASQQSQIAELYEKLQEAQGETVRLREAEERCSNLEYDLEDVRQRHREAIEGYMAEVESLNQKLSTATDRVKYLEGQLKAVQEGGQAHAKFASDKLQAMRIQMEDMEAQAASAKKAATEAEEARAAAEEAMQAAQGKITEREAMIRAADLKVASLGSQLSALQAAAAVDKDAADKQLQTMLARQAEKSLALGRQEGEASMQERVNELAAQLEQRTSELTAVQEEFEQLQAQLEEAGMAEEVAAEVERERTELKQELEKTRAEVVEARLASKEAANEAAEHRATAAERTKKFAVLQAQYKKKEEALRARLEAAESAVEGNSASAGEAAEAIKAAEVARMQAETDRDALLMKLEETEQKVAQLHGQLAAQVEECDAAVSKVAELQASLEAARMSAEAAEASKQSDEEHFERMVAAEVAAHMQSADKRVMEAQEEISALMAQMKTLEGRAEQAENAKIEMSLVLAQLDEGANMSKPISGLPMGARAELLQEVSVKAEEAELAAAVSMRRAQTAEAELAEVKAQLADMEQRAKELGWQVKMLSEPNTIGGGGNQSTGTRGNAVATRSMFDMFGCGGVRPAPR